MNPPYQARTVVAIRRPRRWAGANSDISGQPTEYSAPIATPINSRTTNSVSNEPTKNCSTDPTRNSAMSIMNNGLRPHLSPAHPPSGEPIRMPNSAADVTRPSSHVDMPRSAFIGPVTGPMTPRM